MMRSYRLSRGFIWRNLTVLVVVAAAQWGLGEIAGATLLALGENRAIALSLVAALSFMLPLAHITPVVLYYDCRGRKEGLSLDELARSGGMSGWPAATTPT